MDTALKVAVFSSKLLWMIVVGLAKIGVGLVSVAVPVLLALVAGHDDDELAPEASAHTFSGSLMDGEREDWGEPWV